jgi:F0F1-type ATP synthase assembly protein I
VDRSQRSELTQNVDSSSGSYELVLSGVLISLIGYAIDRSVGTMPLFTLIFAAIGFAGATYSLYRRYTYAMAIEAQRLTGRWDPAQPNTSGTDA